jgi:hypothetical protein
MDQQSTEMVDLGDHRPGITAEILTHDQQWVAWYYKGVGTTWKLGFGSPEDGLARWVVATGQTYRFTQGCSEPYI